MAGAKAGVGFSPRCAPGSEKAGDPADGGRACLGVRGAGAFDARHGGQRCGHSGKPAYHVDGAVYPAAGLLCDRGGNAAAAVADLPRLQPAAGAAFAPAARSGRGLCRIALFAPAAAPKLHLPGAGGAGCPGVAGVVQNALALAGSRDPAGARPGTGAGRGVSKRCGGAYFGGQSRRTVPCGYAECALGRAFSRRRKQPPLGGKLFG